RKAVMSPTASPDALSAAPPVFWSRPCPNSCIMTAAISPVLEQPLPDLKKFTAVPSQNALHVWLRFVLAPSWVGSHVLVGSRLIAVSLILFRWNNAVREACVLPLPPLPGVVQSVPPLFRKSRLPLPNWRRRLGPQVSLGLTKGPASLADAAPPEKSYSP